MSEELNVCEQNLQIDVDEFIGLLAIASVATERATSDNDRYESDLEK